MGLLIFLLDLNKFSKIKIMASRYTTKEPKIVWFVKLGGEHTYLGPYMNKPRRYPDAISYQLIPITQEEAKNIIKNETTQ